MGKRLFIIRHGRARAAEVEERDIDRPLSAEGMQETSRLGSYLHKKGYEISAIISSSAVRAVMTAENIADQINFDVSKIQADEDLYEASVRIVLEKVNKFHDDWQNVILVGHNPVLTYFVEYITGHHFDGMAAGSIVVISCDVDSWEEVSKDNAMFQQYLSAENYSAEL